MKKNILNILLIAISILSISSCKDDDDNNRNYYDNTAACISIKISDVQSNIINDSTQIAKLTGYDPDLYYNHLISSDAPIFMVNIVKDHGQWYYIVFLNEMQTDKYNRDGTKTLKGTITIGNTSYILEEQRMINRYYAETQSLKVNGKFMTNEHPEKNSGYYITLMHQ